MRLTKEQRIINTIKKLNLNENSLDLMKHLISIAKNGVVDGFVYKYEEIRKKVFADNHNHMINAYKNLLDSGLITLQATTLIITVWHKTYQTQLTYNNFTTGRRSYSSVLENQIYITKLGAKAGYKNSDNSNIEPNFTWNKIKGIKVPRTMAGLFTRKIYKSEKTHLDMAWVLAEEEKRQLNKEEIRFLCGLIAQCNTYGQIRDYNTFYAIKVMQDLFEDSRFAVSTGYRVQEQLIRKNIIRINEVKGIKTLTINDYADGFGPGRNYVVLTFAIFRTIFKKLELAAINLFFEQVFQLNNGDNGKGVASANKKVNLKVISAPMDAKTDKNKLAQLRDWLRKRNDSEVFKLILSLQAFFNIEDAGRGNFAFRLKQMYFILKSAVRITEKLVDPLKRYTRKASIIKDCIEEQDIDLSLSDLHDIVNVFARVDVRITKRLIKVLAMDIKDRQQHSRPKIQSMAAYTTSLFQQYNAGVGKAISTTLAYISSLQNEVLKSLSEPIEAI